MIASAFQSWDVFGMKLHFPIGRRRIAYFDTESMLKLYINGVKSPKYDNEI